MGIKHHAWPRISPRQITAVDGRLFFPPNLVVQTWSTAKNEDLQLKLSYFSCQGQKEGENSYGLEVS